MSDPLHGQGPAGVEARLPRVEGWLTRGAGLTDHERRGWRKTALWSSLALFALLHLIGTFATWVGSCSMAFGTEMDAHPNSTLGRFCLGESAYQDNHHFYLWVVPSIGYMVPGWRWVDGRSARWIVGAWIVGVVLAFLYYSPFLLLPG